MCLCALLVVIASFQCVYVHIYVLEICPIPTYLFVYLLTYFIGILVLLFYLLLDDSSIKVMFLYANQRKIKVSCFSYLVAVYEYDYVYRQTP